MTLPMANTHPIDLVILGSTGSIGTQALNVVRTHADRFRVRALAAGGSNLELLAQQIVEFQPEQVAVTAPVADALVEMIPALSVPNISTGQGAVESLAAIRDVTVLNGITGGVGLGATLNALAAGNRLALANKESLVVGGALVKGAQRYPGQVVPVDSEHSALAQALLSGRHEKGMVSPKITGYSELQQLVLTASGGPFRGRTRRELADVTAAQALEHPTWSMGPVVTVNSSTLMNKGLELIEAAWLFDVPPSQIVPVVHPQSLVHSLVTWQDGSSIAQASYPNMEVPIALGLDWPAHQPRVGVPLRWDEPSSWTFEPVDHEVFPALQLAQVALETSPTHAAVLNAANEVAVDWFLAGKVPWLVITDTVRHVVEQHEGMTNPNLDDILGVQTWASAAATQFLKEQRQ